MLFLERWTGILRYAALLVIFLLVYLLVLRPVQKQVVGILKNPARPLLAGGVAGALPAGGEAGPGSANLIFGEGQDARTPEVAQTIELKKELVGRIKADPESASRLVQNWVREAETSQGKNQ
jgi:flagellar M-ring protein FliF